MKVIIAGSRTFGDYMIAYHLVCYAIQKSGYAIKEVISGMAEGIDKAGEMWVKTNLNCGLITVKQFPADWKTHGKAAGPIRNEEMAKYADAAIIIWDGESKGTANMISLMEKYKKPYYLMVVEQMNVKPQKDTEHTKVISSEDWEKFKNDSEEE